MKRKTGNAIVDLSLEYALAIIEFSEKLEETRKYVIAKQLLKAGTSIGANIWESQNAESKADFIHKLKIAAKEADEVEYWLLLCQFSENYPNPGFLYTDLISIKKLLSKIIASSKASLIKENGKNNS
ncbi:MAG: four helix bundle protein [Bacteroidales bacterium]|nr:four helix bundle protein [Bacteroidales bacterium]